MDLNTETSAHSSKKNNSQTRIIFIWMCLQTFFSFLTKGSSRKKKKYKLHSSPASLKTMVGLELHSISHRCVFNVPGEGKWLFSTLQESLPLQTELSPLKSPPAAHVHIKTVNRIPPGNFFHQHSSHGDSEAALRDQPYTVRWKSWTSINFKELHRVLHLETKASPKK